MRTVLRRLDKLIDTAIRAVRSSADEISLL
jgi:hypothetical protein